jgi:hypothetical protein
MPSKRATYTILVSDTRPTEITVIAPGVRDRDGEIYIDPTVQDALLAFVNTLSDTPAVVTWEHAQPDWRERESTRVQ